ncbi:MAG: peptidoglycan editing factor PgeF [Candidatus Cohnella colombiensis]|uniref:Purine nucleoside phosphorylase n=1 Tax=Candidatus Cohnella colombiensis TaxID=3121368 RepID=A0AA95JBL0_9BACL|nr:MAG: peptidoglycan editing factor PgeF [Cohnella sp.]
MEPFLLHTDKDDASLLQLKSWCNNADGITAGFTTRQTGNVALHVGDNPSVVLLNRKRVTELLDWSFETWTCAEQVHGKQVYVAKRNDTGRGRNDRESAFQNTDAIITNEPDLLLVMFFADCVPLYFYDPVTNAIGLAHAGWKGTVANIVAETIEQMSSHFGAKPENINAAIGPSIGSCCYEVDEAVLKHVRPFGVDKDVISHTTDGRAHLDLKQLNRHFMIKAGILPRHIEITSLCTSCRTDLLFSHRMEKGDTGRMMSWLGRKSR